MDSTGIRNRLLRFLNLNRVSIPHYTTKNLKKKIPLNETGITVEVMDIYLKQHFFQSKKLYVFQPTVILNTFSMNSLDILNKLGAKHDTRMRVDS